MHVHIFHMPNVIPYRISNLQRLKREGESASLTSLKDGISANRATFTAPSQDLLIVLSCHAVSPLFAH